MDYDSISGYFMQLKNYVLGEEVEEAVDEKEITRDESSLKKDKETNEGDETENENPAEEVNPASDDSTQVEAEDFSPEQLTRLIESSMDEETKVINATKFLAACEIVPQLFNGLGAALKKGNGNLLDKVRIVRGRQREAAEDLGVDMDELSLQDIIQRDIDNKVTHSGKKARQATRNIIRLVWFLDFIVMLFDLLATNPDMPLRELIQKCWAGTLGPRNKWIVNKATTQLLKVAPVPEKENLLVLLHLEGKSQEEMVPILQTWVDRVDNVSREMWAWLKAKDLESVP